MNRRSELIATKSKAARRMMVVLALSLVSAGQVEASDNFDFAAHHVDALYKGKLHSPDFNGRDKGFALFKTRITEAMKAGTAFAGEYAVMQFGCGTGCSSVVVANNRTGELYPFPRGGEFNQALTLAFTAKSNLMVARWYTDSLWETCVFESFLFDDGKWIAKDAIASKDEATCSGDVAKGAKKAREL